MIPDPIYYAMTTEWLLRKGRAKRALAEAFADFWVEAAKRSCEERGIKLREVWSRLGIDPINGSRKEKGDISLSHLDIFFLFWELGLSPEDLIPPRIPIRIRTMLHLCPGLPESDAKAFVLYREKRPGTPFKLIDVEHLEEDVLRKVHTDLRSTGDGFLAVRDAVKRAARRLGNLLLSEDAKSRSA